MQEDKLDKILKEVTGQRSVPSRDWFKITLGILSIAGIVFSVVSYLFVPHKSYAQDMSAIDERFDKTEQTLAVQELFNKTILRWKQEVQEELRRKVDK